MCIVVVGGHDRMHEEYRLKCKEEGHKVKIFTQMPNNFEKMIGAPDGMVVFTATSSHKMVNVAMTYARKRKIPVVRCHTSSSYSLGVSLKQLAELTAKH